MRYLSKAITIAKLVGEHLAVTESKTNPGCFVVRIPWTWIKETQDSGIKSSFWGEGDEIESACKDLCEKAHGVLVHEAWSTFEKKIVSKEVVIVTI